MKKLLTKQTILLHTMIFIYMKMNLQYFPIHQIFSHFEKKKFEKNFFFNCFVFLHNLSWNDQNRYFTGTLKGVRWILHKFTEKYWFKMRLCHIANSFNALVLSFLWLFRISNFALIAHHRHRKNELERNLMLQ